MESIKEDNEKISDIFLINRNDYNMYYTAIKIEFFTTK